MAGVPAVIISPSDALPHFNQPFARRGSSKRLFRQDAHEDFCSVDDEDLCDDIDSGIGSTTSSFSRTFSDCQIDEASNPDNDYTVRDIADGLKHGCTIGSSPKNSLQAAKQERYRASSGYGTGDSFDLSDSLGSSAASSVFYDVETVPSWQADCDRLIRELTTKKCIEDLDKIESFSDAKTRHVWFWQNNDFRADSISSDDLEMSASIEGSEGFVSAPEGTECHDDDSELCIIVDKKNASELHSASMCHSLTGGNIVKIECPCKQAHCLEARGLLKWLKKCYHLGHLQDCFLCERTLANIIIHNEECLELQCSLPFCHVVKERQQSLLRQPSIEEMKAEVSLVGKLSAMESMLSSLQSLSCMFWDDCQPGAAEAIPLAFLGRFGKFNVLLARMRKAENASTKPSTIVVKKVSRRESLLPALKIVKSFTSNKLVSLLDVLEGGDSHFVLISAFTSGVTFRELLLQVEKYGEWEWRNHFCQVVSALSFLHHYNILFLNWEVDNILVKSDGKQACLLISQGSLTLMPEGKKSIPVDETLQEMLSPYISAPEILQKEKVGFAADVWGCGILMYQLITKKVPHGSLRHLSWSEARRIILSDPEKWTPRVPDECPESCCGVLHQCFSWSPCDRPSVKALLQGSSKPIYSMGSDSFEEDYLTNAAL